MNYVQAVIDRAKEFLPKKTEYALSKALGIEQTTLIKIKKGRGFFGAKQRVRLHEITKIPLEELTAMLEFERAKTDEDKEFWKQRLPRLSAAILIGIVGYAAFQGHENATLAFMLPFMPADTLYIMRSGLFIGILVACSLLLKECATYDGFRDLVSRILPLAESSAHPACP